MTAPTKPVPAGMMAVASLIKAVGEYAEEQGWCSEVERHLEEKLGLNFRPFFSTSCCDRCERNMKEVNGTTERFVLADGNPEFVERSAVGQALQDLLADNDLDRFHAVRLGKLILGDESPIKARRWTVSFVVTSDEESQLSQWDAGYLLKEGSEDISELEITELA